jgi:hypothetical protein
MNRHWTTPGDNLKAALVLFLVACSAACHGQAAAQTKKIPIFFSCTCDDTTGAALATAIRDQLASSPRYAETSDTKAVSYQWHIVTLDPSKNDEGISTAYSAVITFGSHDSSEVFMGHDVGVCGRNSVPTCASDLVAYLDKTVHGQ